MEDNGEVVAKLLITFTSQMERDDAIAFLQALPECSRTQLKPFDFISADNHVWGRVLADRLGTRVIFDVVSLNLASLFNMYMTCILME
jgi:hypothetical protein